MVSTCLCKCEPCKINPPCLSCECMEKCPEECREVIITPEPCCEPIRCPEGPKKNIWKKLFGERKCNVCCENQCVCRKKGTLRPIIRLYNNIFRDSNRKPCSDKQCGARQCKCKSNTCPRRGCFPTDRSLCGCHFYFNLDKLPKRRPCLRSLNCRTDQVAKEYTDCNVFTEEPVRDVEAPPPYRKRNSDGYSYTAEKKHTPVEGRGTVCESKKNILPQEQVQSERRSVDREGVRCSTVSELKKSFLIEEHPASGRKSTTCFVSETKKQSSKHPKPEENRCSQELDPSRDSINFGVTFTKSETMYVRPMNKDTCEIVCKEERNEITIEGKNVTLSNVEETGGSDKIVTFDIVNKSDNDTEQPQELSFDENFSKFGNVKSESFSREVAPLMKRKRVMDQQKSSLKSGNVRYVNAYIGDVQNRRQSLDEQVCQILNKLCTIEKKINHIEHKKQENISIDFSRQKSTVSDCLRDRKGDPAIDSTTNRRKTIKSGTAVIKISHTKSRTCHPVQCCPSTDSYNTPHERGTGRCEAIERKASCIIINVPSKSYHSKLNEEINCCNRPVLCDEVPEDSQMLCSIRQQCYCYDCMCKRKRVY